MLRDRGLRRTSPETTAESLLRGAHAQRGARGLGLDAWTSARGRGRRDRRRRGAGLDRAAGAGADASPVSAAGAGPAARAGRGRVGRPTRGWGGPRTRRRPSACGAWPGCSTARRRRRRCWWPRWCTPTSRRRRRSPRTTGIVARAAERLVLVGPRGRREVAGRARGGAPGPAAGVRVQPARLPRRRPGRRAGLAALRAPRRYAAGAEASPLRTRGRVRAARRGGAARPRAGGTRVL